MAGRKKIKLSDKERDLAVKYVLQSGFYKNRLADYLGISRPTLYRILDDNPDFLTRLRQADAKYCKGLIKKAKPDFVLKTKYREEFKQEVHLEHQINPEKEMKKIDDKLKDKWPEQEDSTSN